MPSGIYPRPFRSIEDRLNAGLQEGNLFEGTPCLIWQKATNIRGYGQLKISGKQVGTHRVAWELAYGSIPEGMGVLHKCDTPPCCNKDHLFLGTALDNNRDKIAKNRQVNVLASRNAAKVCCPRGHAYSPENTYKYKRGRACRTCVLEKQRARRQLRRAK